MANDSESSADEEELDTLLVERCAGPFVPLEPDWKERVREAASSGD